MNAPMMLSPHFALAEFLVSETAARLGIDNDPPLEVVQALKRTAQGLELVRVRLGLAPIIITSGYRSLALNRAIGSKDTSQYVTGEAADFICPRFGTPAEIVVALRDSGIEYDQLILEFAGSGRGWVHCSFSAAPPPEVTAVQGTPEGQPVPVVVAGTTATPLPAAAAQVQQQATDPSIPAKTTFQQDLITAGQRRVNLIWEYTQAVIAITVTAATLSVCWVLVYRGDGAMGAFLLLSNVFFLVVGTYFPRTNHTKTGGVGANEVGR